MAENILSATVFLWAKVTSTSDLEQYLFQFSIVKNLVNE
jgi:hypothetical protein